MPGLRPFSCGDGAGILQRQGWLPGYTAALPRRVRLDAPYPGKGGTGAKKIDPGGDADSSIPAGALQQPHEQALGSVDGLHTNSLIRYRQPQPPHDRRRYPLVRFAYDQLCC